MGEQLRLEYIPLEEAILWDSNPKQHDLGALAESLVRYGFQDPPKYDGALGALVYGNGRVLALRWLKSQGRPAPRGILEVPRRDDPTKPEWLVPVVFGNDLESQTVATAFAVDHNNLTVAGGDFAPWDAARLWNPAEYRALLQDLAERDTFTVTVDADDLDALLNPPATMFPVPRFAPPESGEVKLPVASLRPNDYAPYAMSPQEQAALRGSVKSDGILLPLLVRPIPPDEEGRDHEIVDGMQRYKAALDLGLEEVPVTIREMTLAEAKAACLATNRIGGEAIASRVASVLKDIREELGDDQVRAVTGMDTQRMDSYFDAVSFGHKVGEDGVVQRDYREYYEPGKDYDPIGEMMVFMVPLPADVYHKVRECLDKVGGDWGAALDALVDHWNECHA